MTGRGAGSGGVRVAFVGNVANALLPVVRALQDVDGIAADLFVSDRDAFTARPESADPSLAQAAPAWIRAGPWIGPAAVLAPWRAPLTRALATYDVIVASGPGPIFAQWAGRPWCWYVTGGDLTVKPFPVAFRSWYDSWPHRAGELVGGAWQRRAARRADRVLIQPFAPMTDAVRRLRVSPAVVSTRFPPLPVDTDVFRPDRELTRPDDPTVRRMLASGLAVFHPSRLVIQDDERLRRTGQWKANDVLIRGFAGLVASGAARDPVLVLPDGTMSRDRERARGLIADLGIEASVVWAAPPSPAGFPRHQLVDLYQAADVVADDFGVGWFGYVTLEGLAMARPVISHVDARAMAELYPGGHPILDAATPGQVTRELVRLASDAAARRSVGAVGRAWILQHHATDVVRRCYAELVGDLVTELRAGA